MIADNDYYTYDGIYYHNHFSMEWAQDHELGSGPTCSNCMFYGTELNAHNEPVLMGYCQNCSRHVYNYSRKEYTNLNTMIIEPKKEVVNDDKMDVDDDDKMDVDDDDEMEVEDEGDSYGHPYFSAGYDSY